MQFNETDTPDQHAAKIAQLHKAEQNQKTNRRLEVATALLLGIGGAGLAVETTSIGWMILGGIMALVGVIRISSL